MKRIRNAFSIIFSLIVILNLTSCEKDPSEVGISLQPGSDKIIIASDTLGVETHTVRDSNIASNNRTISLIGSVNESDFGITDASFITQVRLSSSNVEEDAVINPEYMELHLDHTNYYGNPDDSITLCLYQIKNTDFDMEETYYSDYGKDMDTSENNLYRLGEYKIAVNPDDTVSTLKIEDEDFLNIFSDPELYEDNEALLSTINGFYLKPKTQNTDGGGIAYINLISENSRLVLHYSDDNDETSTFDFDINTSCVRINMFDHDYSSASSGLNEALNDTVNEEVAFLHSAAGLKTIIRVKDKEKLESLAEQGINKAQLQVKINPDFDNTYGVPGNLTIIYENSEGVLEFLSDYKISSEHFGGNLSEDETAYIFNIPLFVQELVKNDGTIEVDNNLYMFPLNNRTTAGHCAVYGGAHEESPMQIKIITSDY
ncbi:MAG: DUF4270 family protein [Bacteroidales bacterium]